MSVPFADHASAIERHGVLAVRHLPLDRAVGALVLEVQHRVRVAQRGDDHALGVIRIRRHDHAESRNVREDRLDRLRVVERAVDSAAEWRAQHHRHVPIAVAPIADLRCFADDLIDRRHDEVLKLDLGDGAKPVHRRADRDPDDQRLGERAVEHPPLPELLLQALGDTEHAALRTDVLTEDHHALVALHLLANPVADRLDVRLLGHDQSPGSA